MTRDTARLSLGREALVALVAKFFVALTGFVGVVVFARVLGVDGVGKYYFILAGAKLATQVTSGINDAIKKRVSEIDVAPEEYLGLGLVTNTAFVAVVAAVLWAALPLLREYFGPPVFVLGLVAILGSLSLFALANRVYAGIGHPGASFWVDSLRSVLTLAAQMAFLVSGFFVVGLIFGLVSATIASAAVALLLAGVRPSLPSRETARNTAVFAKSIVPTYLMQNLYSRLDVLLLYVVVGSSAAGLYEPALRLTVPAVFIASSINDSLSVKASGLHSLDESVVEDLRNSLSYTALFAVPVFFGATAIPELLMGTVYGPDFRDGALALVGLGLFQVFNTYRKPFNSVIYGMDRPDLLLRVSTLTLLVNVPLAVVLGFEYGLVGVVAATVVSEAVRVVTYLVVAHRLFDQVLLPRPVLHQFVAGAGMFGAVEGMTRLLDVPAGWPWLLSVVGFGAATYFALLTLISGHFRLTVREVLGPVVRNVRSAVAER